MRPHVLWFDEWYTQELHQVETISDIFNVEESKVDALIVIGNILVCYLLGTALATSLARKIVFNWLKKDILTIDVNIESVCKTGHSIQITEKGNNLGIP